MGDTSYVMVLDKGICNYICWTGPSFDMVKSVYIEHSWVVHKCWIYPMLHAQMFLKERECVAVNLKKGIKCLQVFNWTGFMVIKLEFVVSTPPPGTNTLFLPPPFSSLIHHASSILLEYKSLKNIILLTHSCLEIYWQVSSGLMLYWEIEN